MDSLGAREVAESNMPSLLEVGAPEGPGQEARIAHACCELGESKLLIMMTPTILEPTDGERGVQMTH